MTQVHKMRVAVLTVSDRASRGDYDDETGPALVRWVESQIPGASVTASVVIADERDEIATTLSEWCDGGEVDLVLTNGGTGLGPRDVTPEATLDIVDRVVPGIAELMRAVGRSSTPMADLSRQVAGQRGCSLIVNLPGSPTGAVQSIAAIAAIIPHAVDVMRTK